MGKDYYEILNIDKTSTLEQIKSSYKKLALKWHPDKNPGDTENAKKQFQIISEAYQVLSDTQKRAHYDKYGDIDQEEIDYQQFAEQFQDMESFFDMMFGGNIEREINRMFGSMGIGRRHKKGKKVGRMGGNPFEVIFGDLKDSDWKPKKTSKKKQQSEEDDWVSDDDGWEDEDDNEDDDDKENDYDDLDDDDEMAWMMFVGDNSTDIKGNKFKCKIDGKVLKEMELFDHFFSTHQKEFNNRKK